MAGQASERDPRVMDRQADSGDLGLGIAGEATSKAQDGVTTCKRKRNAAAGKQAQQRKQQPTWDAQGKDASAGSGQEAGKAGQLSLTLTGQRSLLTY